MQPTNERFNFSEGWTRKEEFHGLKLWKLAEYRVENERHVTQTFPWHIVNQVVVVCNSDDFQKAMSEWLEHDHKLGHPDGSSSFQCQGCLEEYMSNSRVMILGTEGGRFNPGQPPMYDGWREGDDNG
jgi:hypothetical protein